MATTMKFKAVASNLTTGEHVCYRLIPVGVTTITKEQFVRLLANALRVSIADAQFTVDKMWDVIQACLMQNKRIELPFMSISLVIEGSIKSMNEQPTKEANPVRVRILIKGEAADQVAAIVLKNVTEMIEAALHEIMQAGASGLNRIENAADLTINGKGLKIDPGAEDEGVWLEKDGVIVKKAEIKYSDESKVVASFGKLDLENGVYQLAVSTRNGASPKGISARIIKRKVTVAIG